MRRPARTWWAFAACAALVLSALGWITHLALGLETREREARAQARFQETLRIALLRMDSALAPLIAREAARPYFHYAPFYAEELAFQNVRPSLAQAEVLVPSPLLRERHDLFRLHFQISPDGQFTSPQAPVGDQCDAALGNAICPAPAVAEARELLARVSSFVRREEVLPELSRGAPWGGAGEPAAAPPSDPRFSAETVNEFNFRQQAASRARGSAQSALQVEPQTRRRPREAVEQGPLVPLWRRTGGDDPQLFLLRLVQVGPRKTIQGIWLDWEKTRTLLLGEVRDLLPQASLAPLPGAGPPPIDRLLAAVPAVLEPGPAPAPAAEAITPARLVLGLGWAAVLVAAGAVGLVLRAALDLGEKRGQFVSAVTHELRTPLTTFRLYSQMLADGMVEDPRARAEYIATLKNESERLSRVVENVLLHARVERGQVPRRPEHRDVLRVLGEIAPRLEARAEEAGMELSTRFEALEGVSATIDSQALEQILLNLVDNACKYAAGGAERRIEIEGRLSGSTVEIVCRDRGPGIPVEERRRLFAPFHRGRCGLETASPGLGLGLSLSRALAREWNGQLELVDDGAPGAAFRLRLPGARKG